MHIHFINLDRSKDRLAQFKAVNSHLTQVTRVPAVEESRIDIQTLTQQGLVKGDILSMYPIGGLCHALSELALWNKAIESGQPVTMADDDCIFNLSFDTRAAELIETLPPDWDLILWGWNFDLFMIFDMLPGVSPCVCQFDQDKLRLNTRAFQELSISPRAHKLIWAFGMLCYTVSPKGARNLKSKAFPLQPMLIPCPEGVRTPPHSPMYRNVGSDNTLNALHRHMNSFVCFPPLVISTNDHSTSTIQPGGAGTVRLPPEVRGDDIHRQDGAQELYNRGNALLKANRFEEALATYGQVLAMRPNDVTALITRGLILEELKRFDEALASYERALTVAPNSEAAHYNRGNALRELKRFDEALASYDKALAINPGSVVALNDRGMILHQLGRFEEALASYDKALAIKPDFVIALSNRGLLLQQVGRLEEALTTYDKALSIDPNHASALNNRRTVVEQLNRSRSPG